MLFGEHAVVYHHPCLVTAVDLRVQVTIERKDIPDIQIDTPALRRAGKIFRVDLKELFTSREDCQTAFITAAIRQVFLHSHVEQGLSIRSDGPIQSFGLGSSSAVTVATVYALGHLFDLHLSHQKVFDLAFSAIRDVQKIGSGFDVAAAVFGGTLYYQLAKPIKHLQVDPLPLVIGFSGDKVSTTNLVTQVASLYHMYPGILDSIFQAIGSITNSAMSALLQKDWKAVGELMDLNQGLLISLGVSTPGLDKMITSARRNGAFGAKLSGAGGGDCMLALVDDQSRAAVENGIRSAGGKVLTLDTSVAGVRLESDID